MNPGERTFGANIDTLRDELLSAIEWNRASVIIAVCNDFWVKIKAMEALKKRLHPTPVAHFENINFAGIQENAIVQKLASLRTGNVVYNAFNLLPNGENTFFYRALNMQREIFTVSKVRIVFWLTAREASFLPIHSPDFWAFRHRVVEFFDSRSIKSKNIGSRLFLWDNDTSGHDYEKTAWEMTRAEDSLKELNERGHEQDKLQLLNDLTMLAWKLGYVTKSMGYAKEGISSTRTKSSIKDQINILTCRAAYSYHIGEYAKAEERFTDLAEKTNENPITVMNLATFFVLTAHKRTGIALAQETAKKYMTDPVIAAQMGSLLFLCGDLDGAVKWFECAAEGTPYHSVSALICKLIMKKQAVEEGEVDLPSGNWNIPKEAYFAFSKRDYRAGKNILWSAAEGSNASYLFDINLWFSAYPMDLAVLIESQGVQ